MNSYTMLTISNNGFKLNLDSNNQITSIVSQTIDMRSINFLRVGTNYNSPYTPTSSGAPATKKYVDDSIATAIGSALGGNY